MMLNFGETKKKTSQIKGSTKFIDFFSEHLFQTALFWNTRIGSQSGLSKCTLSSAIHFGGHSAHLHRSSSVAKKSPDFIDLCVSWSLDL